MTGEDFGVLSRGAMVVANRMNGKRFSSHAKHIITALCGRPLGFTTIAFFFLFLFFTLSLPSLSFRPICVFFFVFCVFSLSISL